MTFLNPEYQKKVRQLAADIVCAWFGHLPESGNNFSGRFAICSRCHHSTKMTECAMGRHTPTCAHPQFANQLSTGIICPGCDWAMFSTGRKGGSLTYICPNCRLVKTI